jgi:hypothetical protein
LFTAGKWRECGRQQRQIFAGKLDGELWASEKNDL